MNFYGTVLEIENEIYSIIESISCDKTEQFIDELSNMKNNVIGIGAGRMGLAMKAFIMRLNHLGISSYFYTDNYIPPLTEKDLVICCSGSGETSTVVHWLQKAKEKSNCKIISLVGIKNSSIDKLSDLAIYFSGVQSLNSNKEGITSIQIMSTANEQAAFLYFDTVSLLLKEKNNMNIKDIKNRHFNVE